ncbi:MAG: uracil-DNA glycosylase [Euryarchaeota archaeon]|nr:uracil-DNA glycosylase [Euryarchaeota archaeon]
MEFDPACTLCRLSWSRTKVVPPDGNMLSPVCFVGEAPGETEDREGRPFIGRAGKILERMLGEQALPRDKVMITNTVKCRPPGNRRPRRDEMSSCFRYLEQELAGRRLVVALGKTACRNLLGRELKLGEEANRPWALDILGGSVVILPAYHPAACLYSLKARESLRETIRIAKGYL